MHWPAPVSAQVGQPTGGRPLKVVMRPVASDCASIARMAPFIPRGGVATATDLLLPFVHVRLGVARPCSGRRCRRGSRKGSPTDLFDTRTALQPLGPLTACDVATMDGDGLSPTLRAGWGSRGRRFKSCQPDQVRAGPTGRLYRVGPRLVASAR